MKGLWIALLVACGNASTPAPPPPVHVPPAPVGPFDGVVGPIVTASEVIVGGVSLGLATDHARLVASLRGVPAATLAYTDDAHADLVLEVARTLLETGHLRVELVMAVGGKRASICTATAAPPNPQPLELVLEGGHVDLGLSAVMPVLQRGLDDAHLVDDLAAPFFEATNTIEVAADSHATGGQLSAVLTVACGKPLLIGDFAKVATGRKGVMMKPLCRKVLSQTPATIYDPERLRAGLPALDAMDLCYQHFEPNMGPRGTVAMTLEIEPDGTVGKHAAAGLNPDVNRCIGWLVGRGVFDQPPAKAITVHATAECNTRCCNGD